MGNRARGRLARISIEKSLVLQIPKERYQFTAASSVEDPLPCVSKKIKFLAILNLPSFPRRRSSEPGNQTKFLETSGLLSCSSDLQNLMKHFYPTSDVETVFLRTYDVNGLFRWSIIDLMSNFASIFGSRAIRLILLCSLLKARSVAGR